MYIISYNIYLSFEMKKFFALQIAILFHYLTNVFYL